ncbi:DUF2326 domain-containing protein [Bacillus sp. RIT 809]|uniref:DUF2326 domain-containing protein n=1 Tax=Bacillus sp. RIT 809 TaxID=2803857 RepID=UPI00194EFD42|nr:DUF2326 domain-containing protein [Bacillus sp. RIT 809]MBM6645851.1 DUF2326 domain-containing protein [Bacillus sp. RIT 809]
MERIVNRIKLKKLYSCPEIFEPIIFEDGVNIILGERSDASTIRGRKTNGVGKSMSIEFLNFCLLKKYSDSRIKLIPNDVLKDDVLIKLDMEIGDVALTICRNRGEQEKPIIIRDGNKITFEKLDEAQIYIKDLLYNNFRGEIVPSFRELISPLIRDERSGFKKILECFDMSRKIPINFTPFLFYLDISLQLYKKILDTVKKIKEIKEIVKNTKKEVTDGNRKKISDVKAELNELDYELQKISGAIESFKNNDAFDSLEKDLLRLEDLLDKLRLKQNSLKYELQKINSLPKPETIENDEIEIAYNQFKEGLGDLIVKSLEETIGFKMKIEKFQRSLVNQRADDIQKELYNLADDIRKVDEEYSNKIKIIDQKGVLKNLKISLKIFEQKNIEYSKKKILYEEYERAEKEKKALFLKKTQEIAELDIAIDEKKPLLDSFLMTLLDIHQVIMGNKECSFSIDTINSKTNNKVVDIEMRIFDDGSHSVDRTKVFIFDMALLFNEYTRKRHPGLLIHDNIFDVDQDTLIQSLNFLSSQESKYHDFQYILTLNRDKIENEETLKHVVLDIDIHQRAKFTKMSKFLKQDYQEI